MKILLVCNAGMSTGILKIKMEEEAIKLGLDLEILAIPITQIDDYKDGVEAILLGPQIRFAIKELKKELGDTIPILAISPMDFGLMNAKNIIEEVLAVIDIK